jgi:glutamate:GABA antiporter
MSRHKVLGVFSLAMITAVSVDSLRNLPATALFGSSLIFFFILGALLFLLPAALVSAELSSTSKDHGGVYAWVKNAFGQRTGFAAVWFQWIENVIWYPAILSFVAGTIGFLFSPQLAQNKTFLITIILCAFWGCTIINLLGIKSSARFSNFCALAGLIIPMCLIIALGVTWALSGDPLKIHFTEHAMLPHGSSSMWVALTGIMLSFCGMEIATVHASDVKNPQHDFPRAMLLATVIIVGTLVCGALSIAIVIPQQKISLVAGIMQAFHQFFSADHLNILLPLIAVMLVIGAVGSVSNWIIAPTRGLVVAFADNNIYSHLQQQNKYRAPKYLLIYQALLVSVISLVFLLLPTVNSSYWLLTALAAQLYMIMYILMFAAGIRLRYKPQHSQPGFRIFGNRTHFGMWLVASAGIIGSALTFMVGFIPPTNLHIGSPFRYEELLVAGLTILSLPPLLIIRRSTKKKSEELVNVVT